MSRGTSLKQTNQLADLLVQSGVVSPIQVEQLLQEQQRWGGRLIQLVLEQGLVTEDQLVQLFHREMRFPVITWDRLRHVPPDVVKLVPVGLCESHDVFPVACELHSRRLRMAMSDPSDAAALRILQDKCGMQIDPVVASISMIRWAVRLYYYGEQIEASALGTRPPSSYGGAPPSSTRPVMPYGTSGEVSRPLMPPGGTGGNPGKPPGTSAPWQTGNHAITGSHAQPYTAQPSGIYPVSPGNFTGTHPHLQHIQPTGNPNVSGSFSQIQPGYTGAVPQIAPSLSEYNPANNAGMGMGAPPHSTQHSVVAVATSKENQDTRLLQVMRELQQVRQEFSTYKAATQQEIQTLQELVTHRFHEHRLMMRGLFDLLVARGYLSKEELVEMLSAIQSVQSGPS